MPTIEAAGPSKVATFLALSLLPGLLGLLIARTRELAKFLVPFYPLFPGFRLIDLHRELT